MGHHWPTFLGWPLGARARVTPERAVLLLLLLPASPALLR